MSVTGRGGEARLHIGGLEGVDHLPDVALQETVEIVEREVHAVIGDAVLGKIVSAHFFAPVARADLSFALRRVLFRLLALLLFQQAGTQDLHRLFLVLLLRATVLAAHAHARGKVQDLHGGVRGIHALAARAAGAADIDLEFVGLQFQVHLLGLGQHGHGRDGSVDAPLRLRGRDALHAMHAALVAELAEDAVPES